MNIYPHLVLHIFKQFSFPNFWGSPLVSPLGSPSGITKDTWGIRNLSPISQTNLEVITSTVALIGEPPKAFAYWYHLYSASFKGQGLGLGINSQIDFRQQTGRTFKDDSLSKPAKQAPFFSQFFATTTKNNRKTYFTPKNIVDPTTHPTNWWSVLCPLHLMPFARTYGSTAPSWRKAGPFPGRFSGVEYVENIDECV